MEKRVQTGFLFTRNGMLKLYSLVVHYSSFNYCRGHTIIIGAYYSILLIVQDIGMYLGNGLI